MFDASNQALIERLEELASLETVSPFSVAFYRLILRLLDEASREEAERLACAALLDVELRYHRELKRLTDESQVSFDDLRSTGEKHRIGLESVQEFARRIGGASGQVAAAAQLVLAECGYHLRRTEQVIAALERAGQLGVDDPLVHFALGYNRYALALESCTGPGEKEGELAVRDPLSFQVQCLRAVGAFEDGLTGDELDAQLYWWIGTVLEAAGLTDAAQDAYDRSAALFAETEERPGAAEASVAGVAGPAPAITEEEVRLAGELLKGKFAPSDILGREFDDRS
jgi:tetratricopeptide (TPR) repeat protein